MRPVDVDLPPLSLNIVFNIKLMVSVNSVNMDTSSIKTENVKKLPLKIVLKSTLKENASCVMMKSLSPKMVFVMKKMNVNWMTVIFVPEVKMVMKIVSNAKTTKC